MGFIHFFRVIIYLIIIGLPLNAWSLPAMRMVSQEEGDAVVSLSLESQYIEDDSVVPCESVQQRELCCGVAANRRRLGGWHF